MSASDATAQQSTTILDALAHHAEKFPDRLAFNCQGVDEISFGDLYREASERARGLASLGLGRGERGVIILPTSIEQICCVFAIQLCGAAPVVLDAKAPPPLLARRIAQCGPRVVLAGPDLAQTLADALGSAPGAPRLLQPGDIPRLDDGPALPEVTPEDVAYLQFTSGTTGEPKAAVILHRNLAAYRRLHSEHLGWRDDDILLTWVPLYHDFGLVGCVFRSVYTACPSYLLAPEIASLRIWLQTASRIGATVTTGPDFGYRYVTRSVSPDGLDLSRLSYASSGGEPVRIETIRRFEERFGLQNKVVAGYGLAETVLAISMARPGEPRRVDAAGNVANGRPFVGLDVTIVDSDAHALPAGQVGQITVKGPSVFAGYLDDEAATREVLREGRLFTGDMGYLDDDGHLYILGRAKALIKRGGSFIAPREVEMAADGVLGVKASAAIGVSRSSALASEDLVVVAEAQPEDADTPEKRKRITDAIATAVVNDVGHAPSDVVLVKPRTIPRTGNGKVQYGRLREMYLGGTLGDRAY